MLDGIRTDGGNNGGYARLAEREKFPNYDRRRGGDRIRTAPNDSVSASCISAERPDPAEISNSYLKKIPYGAC